MDATGQSRATARTITPIAALPLVIRMATTTFGMCFRGRFDSPNAIERGSWGSDIADCR